MSRPGVVVALDDSEPSEFGRHALFLEDASHRGRVLPVALKADLEVSLAAARVEADQRIDRGMLDHRDGQVGVRPLGQLDRIDRIGGVVRPGAFHSTGGFGRSRCRHEIMDGGHDLLRPVAQLGMGREVDIRRHDRLERLVEGVERGVIVTGLQGSLARGKGHFEVLARFSRDALIAAVDLVPFGDAGASDGLGGRARD